MSLLWENKYCFVSQGEQCNYGVCLFQNVVYTAIKNYQIIIVLNVY